MTQSKIYKRHRFPTEIIQYSVWLYHRFNLSHRDIEDLLAERGFTVSYEAIRFLFYLIQRRLWLSAKAELALGLEV